MVMNFQKKYTEMLKYRKLYISSLIKDTFILYIGLSVIPIPGVHTQSRTHMLTFYLTTNPLTKTNLDQTYYGL